MKISKIKIRNFRKLKKVTIDLNDDETVFIGANNSGKTSAMIALRYFLKQDTLSIYANHSKINTIRLNIVFM